MMLLSADGYILINSKTVYNTPKIVLIELEPSLNEH